MRKLLLILFLLFLCFSYAWADTVKAVLLDLNLKQRQIKVLKSELIYFTYKLSGDFTARDKQNKPLPSYALLPGDEVELELDASLAVKSLKQDFFVVSGQLIFINKEKGILDCGEIFELAPEVQVRCNGLPYLLTNLQAGKWAALRINPGNHKVYLIETFDFKASAAKSKLKLKSLVFKIVKPLKAGGILKFRMLGTSKARAFIDIMGVARNMPLKESQPGIYEGKFKVYNGLDVKETYIVGHLEKDSDLLNAARNVIKTPLSIATSSPQISHPFPAPDSVLKASAFKVISASLAASGSLIEPQKTRVWLDGKVVSRNLQKMAQAVIYIPSAPLPPGKHKVAIEVYDKLGNQSTRSWSFRVE
jgi:hypothetical protein